MLQVECNGDSFGNIKKVGFYLKGGREFIRW